MGFYGHISNVQRTSMTFDKIYPNRTIMDASVHTDGVYAGRYVLVEYTNPLESDIVPSVIQFDGMLYALPPKRSSWKEDDHDPTSPDSYLVKLVPLKVNADLDVVITNSEIKPETMVVCSSIHNLGVEVGDNDEKHIVTVARKQHFKISNANGQKMSYNLLYNYATKSYQLDSSSTKETKTGCAYIEVGSNQLNTDKDTADMNYLINFNLDQDNYASARGYDSTVWQKTYVHGTPKYVMIAELNSVVPALDISADAPTFTPIMPHFSQDSTNIYYKLHMQPTWGFRIKAANPELRLPMLDYNGNKYTGPDGGNIQARYEDDKKYESDEKISWIKTALNQKNGYDVTYLSEQDNIGTWQTDNSKQIDGAIYYNKAGFNKDIINHSDEEDEIALTPTGYSGHRYPTHDSNGTQAIAPDVNELSIMLPSIGNTIADVWDLIYGNTKINNNSKYRNTTIRWEDAKKVQAKDGLRLVNNNSLLGYTYDTNSVNTLAGVINSAQDIIGMIITDDYPVDLTDIEAIEKLNEDYIYYQDNKYYFKKPTYEYTPVTDENPIEPVELADWEKYKNKVWWKDTNNAEHPDYIQEATYRDNREYVQGVKVPGAGDRGNPRQFKGAEYQKGKYYIWTDTNSKDAPLLDNKTKAPYHIYYVSEDEKRDVNKRYMELTLTPTKLKDKGIYYVPNKYYLGKFVPTTIKDETDFRKKLADGVRLFIGTTAHTDYGLCGNVTELTAGDYAKIGQYTVHYLTLSTCEWTAEEYRKRSENANTRPVLFYSTIESALGTPQSYYVINKRYEYFTDEKTIESSPGVYYHLKIEEGKTVQDYVDDNNFLKPGIVLTDSDKDQDIHMDPGYMYFREIVELELAAADQVVNIREAVIVEPDDLPQNLYQAYNEDGRKGYRQVTANSFIISQAKNCGAIPDLYLLENAEELVVGYISDTYYYQITDEGHSQRNSVIIDNRKEPDKNINYWTPDMINKRKLTDEEVEAGKQAGETYYVYIQKDNCYVIYEGNKLESNGEYYVSSLKPAPEFYTANKYYYQNATGEYILDSSETFTEGREYFKNPQLYVIEDPNGFYDKGAIWPLGSNPSANSGIVLGKREKIWALEELKGFDVSFNTLHGLLLRLNKWMLQNDTLTRDNTTLQGALNQLNDLIHRFGQMKAGQLMIVDDAGRMRGVNAQGDNWININIDADYANPSVNITHKFTGVSNTVSTLDLNATNADTINLYTPKVDDKGHLVGNNIETVTLPYGYKKVNLLNSSSELDSPDDLELVIQDKVIANNTQDTLLFKAGNKWIKFDATSGAVNDTVHVYHETEDQRVAVTKNTDLNNGTSIIGPVLQSFTRDRAGHVNDLQPVSYTLPNGYSHFKTGEDAISDAQNTMDTFVFSGDNWILPTITQGKLTLTHINEAGLLPAGVDTIGTQNPSFGESFNMWAYELDDNGHCINHQKEAIYLPTSIEGLKTPAELDKYYTYIKTNQSLTDALIALETGINDLSNWAVGAISDAYLDLAQKTIQKDATFDYGDEKLTINELFAKVKALENQLTT